MPLTYHQTQPRRKFPLDLNRAVGDLGAMNQVVVFHMSNCPACKRYLPRFKRQAVKYRAFLNIQTVNVSTADKRIQDAAQKFEIKAVPTTLVLDEKDNILKRLVGDVDDKKIEALLASAAGESHA